MSPANKPPMTTILLSGSLAQAFGRKHLRQLDSGTTNEAFSALKHTVPGFEDFIRNSARSGLRFVIFRNRENVGEDELSLSGTTEIRIVPVIAGSKGIGSMFRKVFDVAGIVIGAVFGGVMKMLSPVPNTPSQQEQASTENKPSYLFNGAFNSTQQGLPVPVIYGQMLVGSSVIAVGTWTEAIPA